MSVIPGFLRANLWLLLFGAAIGTVFGGVASSLTASTFESTATVMTSADSGPLDQGALGRVQFLDSRVDEYAALAVTDSFVQRVVTMNNLRVSAGDLSDRLYVGSPRGTGLLDLTVRASSPVVAADQANAVARELTKVIPERENLLPVRATVVATAPVPSAPFNNSPLLYLVRYAVAGLTVALGAALWRSYSQRSMIGRSR
ncbi:YveK family protein [Gordonia hankookensis]|uniref:Capsular polysaccharide biosynthesis protein n=1 Tax=Gordonia hankookensis TaxID=589403 RepID=A0ABR7W891_9ACTN|nr:hypothetical protein [Gordonia hankookensis]MBD1319028.1 hypothetical protein [Gordonia hankookensis]